MRARAGSPAGATSSSDAGGAAPLNASAAGAQTFTSARLMRVARCTTTSSPIAAMPCPGARCRNQRVTSTMPSTPGTSGGAGSRSTLRSRSTSRPRTMPGESDWPRTANRPARPVCSMANAFAVSVRPVNRLSRRCQTAAASAASAGYIAARCSPGSGCAIGRGFTAAPCRAWRTA